MRIYISGKMSGSEQNAVMEKFDRARRELEEAEHEVLTPTSLPQEEAYPTLSHQDYMHVCYAVIDICDAVYMLKDWTESPGARAEHAFAKAIGLEVMYEEDSVDMSIRDAVEDLIDNAEKTNAGKVFVKLQRVLKRDWDMILTVVRHKEKGVRHG